MYRNIYIDNLSELKLHRHQRFRCMVTALLAMLVLWLSVSLPSHAQQVTFNTLSTAQGLSHFSVSGIYPDNKGEIWIATRMGLNCYDGSSVTTYTYQGNHPYTLPSNTVQRLVGDGKGSLYLLCSNSLVQMDLATRRFYTLVHNNVGAVGYFGQLYYSSANKLYLYNLNQQGKGKADSNSKLIVTLPKGTNITKFFIDHHHRLWIGTARHGAFLLEGRRLSHPIATDQVEAFFEDNRHHMWIGTWHSGCYEVSTNGKTVRHGRHDGFGSNFFRIFCQDRKGHIWMGTADGLVRYDPKSGDIHIFKPDGTEGSMSDKSVWTLALDKQGTLWIGTYFGGVNYMNPAYQFYTHYRASANGLTNNVVGRMTEDDKGNLWICTEGGGLNVLDKASHHLGRADFFPYQGSGWPNLKAIYFDRQRQTLWVGTHLGGLVRIDLQSRRTHIYRYEEGNRHSLPSDIVRDIIGYGRQLIIGTQQGVVLFDPDKGESYPLMSQQGIDYVSSVCLDRKDNLWVATEGDGAYVLNMKTRAVRHYHNEQGKPNSLGSDNLNHLFVDNRGQVWIATSGDGIQKYRPESDDFAHYGEQQQLVGNNVYSIVQSSVDSRQLLLITNKGFSTFDENTKTFYNYLAEDGFPLSTANEQALYITHNGMVCLGSVDGLFTFDERELFKTRPSFNLYFSRLIVNGKEVQPLDSTGILQQALPYVEDLSLKHNQATFSIELATTNSIKGYGGELFYRLSGYQDTWMRVPANQRMLSFVNLPTGHYTLELRSSAKGVAMAHLNIRVMPPWYLTWWAFALYAIAAFLLIRQRVVSYKHRVVLQEQLKYNKQRIKDVEQMNHSKIEFFTNISHEIRTPLTVIVALSESLLHTEHFPAYIYNKVLGIYKNCAQLRDLVTELLDFRKQEEGKMRIKVSKNDFAEFVEQSCLLFIEYARSRSLKLECDLPEHCSLWFDPGLMQKVVNNLISNALKHTPKDGRILVTLSNDDKECTLKVSNTGKEIPVEEIKKIFENFYQTEHNELLKPGTGLGLALSKAIVEGHHGSITVESDAKSGTLFTVRLPMGESAFSPEEKATVPQQETEEADVMPMKPQLEQERDNTGKTSDQPPHSKMLVVEDNEAIRKLLVDLLSPYYQVETAGDGAEGLTKAHEIKPDIILSDVVMPNMSGIELCRCVKQDFTICHIPVVLLTARDDVNTNMESLKTGADDYITKPFNSSLLISRCNNIVNTRRMLQRKFSEHPQESVDLVATNPMDKKMMEQAMKIIQENYTNSNFNVEDFARAIGMSRTALFTKWKQLTGDTPKSFILRLRLRKSAEMLRAKPELSINDVSTLNGFSSAKYFCKCFKDFYKMQPSAYRKGNDVPSDKKDKEIEDEKAVTNEQATVNQQS